ncbi:unnamed protein product [Durusdinium trenchii]|uniref:Secreted protein n=1 Tax=Durusdinium trenchii TaxID=1381693 RepID=A0ABP0HLP0_9DINO
MFWCLGPWLRRACLGPVLLLSAVFLCFASHALKHAHASMRCSKRICCRRRFVASQAAQIYQGAFLGWVDAVILEDAEEIADAIPGQRLQENGETADVSEALCPEVLVKCHLRYDDAEEMEILEVPSGCVRYISGFN